MERSFCLIGHPLGHSMSAFIHGELFRLSGKPGQYRLWDIPPEELSASVKKLRELNGFNVTIPYKMEIIPFLDRLSEKAETYRSVNTVQCGRECVGYNTDAAGFLHALQSAGMQLGGRTVLCGAGGVAHTMAYEAALAGAELILAVRPQSFHRARALQEEIRERFGKEPQVETLEEVGGAIDLLINATPAGMYPWIDASPVAPSALSQCKAVFDAVYNPEQTQLVQTARAKGIPAEGGMAMLVWQAAAAHEIWDGSVYSDRDMEQLIGAANTYMKSTMPA